VYLSRAREIATAAMTLLVDADGILTEPCEASSGGCDTDQTQFKGIFVRYLSYLYNTVLQIGPQWLTIAEQRENLLFLSSCRTFFINQARSIWNDNRNENNELGIHWAGPCTAINASTHSSALDALIASMTL